jgi:phage terminase small subunit
LRRIVRAREHLGDVKQQRFVEEYLIDLKGTQAAIRAGYCEKTANRIASENLSKLDVQAAISEAQRRRAERTRITQDRVVEALAHVAFYDIRRLFDFDFRAVLGGNKLVES